jgi:hypothetical protein
VSSVSESRLVSKSIRLVLETKINIAICGQSVHLDWQTYWSKSNLEILDGGTSSYAANLSQRAEHEGNSVLLYQPVLLHLIVGYSASSFDS